MIYPESIVVIVAVQRGKTIGAIVLKLKRAIVLGTCGHTEGKTIGLLFSN